MAWLGNFIFGNMWTAYRGPAAHNTLHAHAALQLVFCQTGTAKIVDHTGRGCVGHGLFIRPGVPHAIFASGPLSLLYVEPRLPAAFTLLDGLVSDDIGLLPDEITARFDVKRPLKPECENLLSMPVNLQYTLDPRIQQALFLLDQSHGRMSLSKLASELLISSSRLRVLAKEQLGFPLSTWLIWRKLERASRALSNGEPLAIAALAGGFSDQAHFSRAMRRMFGITPKMAIQALR